MARNLEKSLEEFEQMTQKKTSRKGRISADELQDVLFLSLKESAKWGANPQIMELIYTPWKIGYIAGYKAAKNELKRKN